MFGKFIQNGSQAVVFGFVAPHNGVGVGATDFNKSGKISRFEVAEHGIVNVHHLGFFYQVSGIETMLEGIIVHREDRLRVFKHWVILVGGFQV